MRSLSFKLLTLALLISTVACGRFGAQPPLSPNAPPLTTAALSPAAYENLAALESAVAPRRDLVALAQRFHQVEPDLPRPAPEPAIGAVVEFWVKDSDNNSTTLQPARLAYMSDDLLMWVPADDRVDEADLGRAAERIEQGILPTDRQRFGAEVQPGIDRDPRLNILHARQLGAGVAGYFSQADSQPRAVNPFSNEREIIYINLDNIELASDAYYRVIAHEFVHLIQWSHDPGEAIWLNEGLAELAGTLNGLGPSDFLVAYAAQPDVQLTNFVAHGDLGGAHYGSAYLFSAFLAQRLGAAGLAALVANPLPGEAGIVQTAPDLTGNDFEVLFGEWLLALLLASREASADAFDVAIPPLAYSADRRNEAPPTLATVHQFGADFIRLRANEPRTLYFTGSGQTRLLPTDAPSGERLWSSLPADNADMTLTRPFDLTAVPSASLNFAIWYDIEAGWDYAYVMVSTDAGASWEMLETPSSTRYNPQGNGYGPAFSGVSGGGETAVWENHQIDLTPYAGQEIWLRFEYITDDVLHLGGVALDDVAIPEIGYATDFEGDADGWLGAGFVQHSNVLPQRFQLQLVTFGETVSHQVLTLGADNEGQWPLPFGSDQSEGILIIAATTPVTTQPVSYSFEMR